jgi:hypothetical protein
MPDESKQDDANEHGFAGGCINPHAEHLVVLCVLGERQGYPLAQVRADLDDLPPEWIEDSIESLERAGVVVVKDTRLHATEAAQRLDDLDMISV